MYKWEQFPLQPIDVATDAPRGGRKANAERVLKRQGGGGG